MFKIESKVKNGGVWDRKNKRLLRFVNGVLETNDAAIAEKCKAVKGFTVTGAADAKVPEKFAGWDVEQLKVYASTNGIDIGGATSVNGVLKKITEAEAKNQ